MFISSYSTPIARKIMLVLSFFQRKLLTIILSRVRILPEKETCASASYGDESMKE
jgi:hypothetical protein